MLIGYARVSKNEQNLDLQRDALIKAGCREKNIFTDKITGTKQERKGLEQALTHLREGDTFVVWRLDRLGRSLKHLNELPRSLLRGINPKTPKPQNSCNWTSWRCNGLSVCAWPCFWTDWRRAASWPCRPTGLIQSPVDHKAPPHNGFLTAGTR